jgi:hypothetical protein
MTSLVLLMKHFETLIVSHSNISSTLHTLEELDLKPEKPISTRSVDGWKFFNFPKTTEIFMHTHLVREWQKLLSEKSLIAFIVLSWATSSYYVEFYNESFPFSINTHTQNSLATSKNDEKRERIDTKIPNCLIHTYRG